MLQAVATGLVKMASLIAKRIPQITSVACTANAGGFGLERPCISASRSLVGQELTFSLPRDSGEFCFLPHDSTPANFGAARGRTMLSERAAAKEEELHRGLCTSPTTRETTTYE